MIEQREEKRATIWSRFQHRVEVLAGRAASQLAKGVRRLASTVFVVGGGRRGRANNLKCIHPGVSQIIAKRL